MRASGHFPVHLPAHLSVRCASGAARRGFTLLEVLVALAIVAIALAAGLRALGSLTADSEALRVATLAAWSAQNALVQRALDGTLPDADGSSAACPQAELNFLCVEATSVGADGDFRRVEVGVYEAGAPQRAVADLVSVVRNAV